MELTRLTTRISIEMTGDTKRYLISAKQGDKATRYIVAKLLNDGMAYTIPSGARVVFNVEKPDGKHVYNACSYSGSEVTIELTNQTLAAAGTAYCDIEIRTSDDTQIITSASFTIEIEKSMRNDDAILSSDEFKGLEGKVAEYIEHINKSAQDAQAAQRALEEAAKKAEAAAKESETKSKTSETNSKASEEAAKISEANAKASEKAAGESAAAARSSEAAAEDAVADARKAAQNASESASTVAGKVSEVAAKASEAAGSASAAASSASQANASAITATSAKQGAEAAKDAAGTSEINAAASATAALSSAQSASTSKESAAESEAAAEKSAEKAAVSAEEAAASATAAAGSAETAKQYSGKPPKPQGGTWRVWDAADGEYKDTGIKSVLSIVKSYPSVAAMEADKANMQEGDLVIIASNTEDADNSKLFVHNGADWAYLSDLSGLQGVGIASIEKTFGDGSSGSIDIYTITLTDGSASTFTVYNGLDGTGTGDMVKSVYDAKGKNRDVFDYVDDGLSGKADLQGGKIPEEQIPELGYVPNSQKGDAGGVATLGADGKVPSSQLPSLDYIPATEKGQAGGVATLDASGRVPAAQLPEMDYEPSGSVSEHNASPTAHNDMRTSIAGKGDTLEYNADESKLYLKSGDAILSTVEIEGGSGGGIKLAGPTGVSLTNEDEAVAIKWTDPPNIEVGGQTIAAWAGTLVVRKVGSAPESRTDGTIVIDSKTRDAYKDTGFVDAGLTNGMEYFYGIFPYTTDKAYTYGTTESITPAAIYPDAPIDVAAQGGDEEAVISFAAPDNATGMKIAYSAQQPATPETPYGTILTDVESPYTLSGLTNDTTYYVTVYSTNAKGRDTASETKSVTPAAIYPDAPTSSSVKAGDATAIVTFSLPENATGAKIAYSTQQPESSATPYGTVISNAVSPYTIAGLTNDIPHYITVYSTNAKGRDAAGEMLTVTPTSTILFGFVIDQNESDPDSMITYIEDNANFTPAHMDYDNDVFVPGSWTVENGAWFMDVKPCMLNYDGTVAYYLNPNKYKEKADGNPSDVANADFPGNAMVQIPKVYWKIVDNGDDTANVYVCNKKLDEGFVCWSHVDANGNEIPYSYMPAYLGSLAGGKLRSLSEKAPMTNRTAQSEMDYARSNNLSSDVIWHTETFSDRMLINLLLMLIGKSTDTQAIFGTGINSGGQSGIKISGTMDRKGLFWGNQDNVSGVKVFGIEHYWGNSWRRIAGWINDGGTQKVKMTYGKSDGSTAEGYNLTGSGYVAVPGSSLNGNTQGYISKCLYSEKGVIPTAANGSASTYYCDILGFDNSVLGYVITGSSTATGAGAGAFGTNFHNAPSATSWGVASAISCKPLA